MIPADDFIVNGTIFKHFEINNTSVNRLFLSELKTKHLTTNTSVIKISKNAINRQTKRCYEQVC